MTKANTENWLVGVIGEDGLDVADGLLAHAWITGPIAEEKAVELGFAQVAVPWNHVDSGTA